MLFDLEFKSKIMEAVLSQIVSRPELKEKFTRELATKEQISIIQKLTFGIPHKSQNKGLNLRDERSGNVIYRPYPSYPLKTLIWKHFSFRFKVIHSRSFRRATI
jgi:hypothetical protein